MVRIPITRQLNNKTATLYASLLSIFNFKYFFAIGCGKTNIVLLILKYLSNKMNK